MKLRRRVFTALRLCTTLTLVACEQEAEPRPQWVVQVTTDAVIPMMGDRLLVEVMNESGAPACGACRRETVVSAGAAWPVTFGIAAPSSNSSVYLRVRLYRADHVGSDGQPRPESTIDVIGLLPGEPSGIVPVELFASVECLGVPASLSPVLTCAFENHKRQPMAAPILKPPVDRGLCGGMGSTRFARRPSMPICPKSHELYGAMACVPGGVFFMGNLVAPASATNVDASPWPERFVAVDSFLMDRDEVTAAQFRAWTDSLGGGCPEGLDCESDGCTFKSGEDAAINCVSQELAQAYCAAQGKRLPNEIEWEYAASNGQRESRFPWGDETPTCDIARLGGSACPGSERSEPAQNPTEAFRPSGSTGLADATLPPWPRREDYVPGPCETAYSTEPSAWPFPEDIDQHVIHALAGNVSEWTSFAFAAYDAEDEHGKGCWIPDVNSPAIPPPGEDAERAKRCESSLTTPVSHSVRGGAWSDPFERAWSATRASSTRGTATIGFRCVKDLK